jgi:predicted transposase YbfD/YdcC
MNHPEASPKLLTRLTRAESFPVIAGALACILIGALMALGVVTLWQLDDIPVTNTFKQQMMHRKTRTMTEITDGLVRGRLGGVEASAERMWQIGHTLNWYLSSDLYENNDEVFRDSTSELIEAARQRDYDAAKEAALRLERSCIECHALVNRVRVPSPTP